MFAAVSDVAKPGENTGRGDRAPAPGRETGTVKTRRSASSDFGLLAGLVTAVARIEQRQTVHEQVARRVVDMLAIHNEKLDAIIEAATREPGPSPVVGVLSDILESLREQESLLVELPGTLAETIRDEWLREPDIDDEPDAENPEMEPAGPPAPFDDRTNERH
jgi:hypothetical protein